MRTAFINSLVKMADQDESIFLLCGDLGFSVLEVFRDKFPKRFLNVGIAEQNMAGIAAGLALQGYRVFIYSIGNFPSLRALEQIRYDVCYHNLPVTIVSVGAGFAYGPLGCSHHATEDFAIMRSLPNMIVYNPCEARDVALAISDILKSKGPSYLRLGKAGEPLVYNDSVVIDNFTPLVQMGEDILILSTGSITYTVKEILKKNNFNVSLFSITKFCPYLKESLKKILKEYRTIYTVEEHQLNAGFGSAISEILVDLYASGSITFFPKVKRIGIKNQFIAVAGTQDDLRNKYVLLENQFIENLKNDLNSSLSK